MDRHQFISLIKSPSQLQQSNIADIEKVIDAFPYSQTAYLLLAKASSNAGSMHAYQKLKTAAVYAGNRAVLKALINENQVTADNSSPLNLPEHISVEENSVQENIIQLPVENVVEIAQVEAEIVVKNEPFVEVVEDQNETQQAQVENTEIIEESVVETTDAVSEFNAIDDVDSTQEETIFSSDNVETTHAASNVEIESSETNTEIVTEIQLEEPIEEEITQSIDEVEISEENIVPLVVEEKIVPLPANIPHLAEEVAFNLKQLRFVRLEAMKELEKRELEEISARIIPFVIDDTIEEVDLSEIPDEEEILEETKEESIEEKIDELIAEVNQEIEETETAIVEEIIAQPEPEEKIFQFKNLQVHQDLENIIENSRYGDMTSHQEGEEHLSTDLVLDYLLAINKEKKKKKNSENKRIADEDLIDKFIKLRPSISKISKLEMNGLKANNEDLSLKNSKLNENIISETLANILYKQGKILSAIEMYDKLSLKNSDKKLYFEEIIQKLKTEL